MNIQIRAKLSAYTKSTLPTKVSDLENDLNFISEAPADDEIYARKDKQWVSLDQALERDTFVAGNGIRIDKAGHEYTISTKDWFGSQEEFNRLTSLDPTMTYYVYEEEGIKIISGGDPSTSVFEQIYLGGNPTTEEFDIYMSPLNSEGE